MKRSRRKTQGQHLLNALGSTTRAFEHGVTAWKKQRAGYEDELAKERAHVEALRGERDGAEVALSEIASLSLTACQFHASMNTVAPGPGVSVSDPGAHATLAGMLMRVSDRVAKWRKDRDEARARAVTGAADWGQVVSFVSDVVHGGEWRRAVTS